MTGGLWFVAHRGEQKMSPRLRRREKKVFVAGCIAAAIAVKLWRRYRDALDLQGKTVFVTGGSRGLGLLLAQEFGCKGARVAISARDPEELQRAAEILKRAGIEALTIEADMTMREEAYRAVHKVREHFGQVDVLINNAGTISVGPMETMTVDDYRDSLNTHFWAACFATMAALPEMKARREGRIVNISSIGGKIAVPHLLPYSVGKFALTGFSEGLRAELRRYGVLVTTVCPGLMRTGSPRNATFKGKHRAEYGWFSLSAGLPILSMSAERAARQIVRACREGSSEVVLSLPARLLARFHGAFPGATADFMALANALLPAPGGVGREPRSGASSESKISPSWATTLNERAAVQNNEVA
jgi:short-subunit dehydrogenase